MSDYTMIFKHEVGALIITINDAYADYGEAIL